MNLYRIMLVDDEEEVRKSIIKKIDWEAAGFQVVGDAENGEDALEKLENLEADVVLTDIRMPYMDGLTLTEKISQKYPFTKVVIFSGFDDFEYAQKAIKLNVTEYILKPVNVEELTAILKKIKKNLDEEIEQKRNVNTLRESYRNSLPIIREHYLNDMVRGEADEEEIDRRLLEYGIDILDAKKWLIAVADVERDGRGGRETLSLHRERELIPISVKKIMEEKLEDYCRFTMFNSSTEMVLIAAIDGENTQTGMMELLVDICKECARILEVKVTIGVGESCLDLRDMKRSFQTAMDALGYRAIVGEGSVIYINDVEPVSRGKLQFSSQEESELIAAIKFGPREKIERTVFGVVEKMDDAKVHFRQYQAYILSVMNTVIQLIQQYDLNITEMFGSDRDYFEIISSLQKREDFCTWLTTSAVRINEAISEERTNTTRNVIQEAKQYILDNYHDPELSVEKICRHLHMSPAYFSTMFKKETGQAYIAYLTDVRLNKAVELLNKTDDKTYVIASKVGYQEQNYFSYVFKKKFGVSPTKYRGAK
ncbi:response regulator [Clostridium sp. AM58-1XD]|uniref:response regulator n=1 Tax=Clostridium sp. AM58-1XD TaxID=2292307 RepID=UPI000E4F320A|nr:response regulator [Clostridium sp. AM58-1XD]RGZ00593.1 response regulator [Clostridium sp. AM58-1XD]